MLLNDSFVNCFFFFVLVTSREKEALFCIAFLCSFLYFTAALFVFYSSLL